MTYEDACASYDALFKQEEPCVYLMWCEATGLTKIGIATSPERRRKQLENSIGCEVILWEFNQPMIFHDLTAKQIESIMHKHFKQYRKHGEWFALDDHQQGEAYRILIELTEDGEYEK